MANLVLSPKVVFVPFQLIRGNWIKCTDLPRFEHPHEVIEFLVRNKGLAGRMLEWKEHDEPWAIDEFIKGVGIKH